MILLLACFHFSARAVKAKAVNHVDHILALNALHETETSPLSRAQLTQMLDQSFHAAWDDEGRAGYLISFDQGATYESPNFLWFKARYPRFIYIDRVVVAAHARRRGIARRLYESLFDQARAAAHGRIVCEINLAPANPGSLAFHKALGFAEVGQADLGPAKRVSYQAFAL